MKNTDKKTREGGILEGFIHKFSLSYKVNLIPKEDDHQMDAIFEGRHNIGVELTEYVDSAIEATITPHHLYGKGMGLKKKICQIAYSDQEFMILPLMNITIELDDPYLLPKKLDDKNDTLAQAIVDIIKLYPEKTFFANEHSINEIAQKLGEEKAATIRNYVHKIQTFVFDRKQTINSYSQDEFILMFLSVGTENDAGFLKNIDEKSLQEIIQAKQAKKSSPCCTERYLIIHSPAYKTPSNVNGGIDIGIYDKVFLGSFAQGYYEIGKSTPIQV